MDIRRKLPAMASPASLLGKPGDLRHSEDLLVVSNAYPKNLMALPVHLPS